MLFYHFLKAPVTYSDYKVSAAEGSSSPQPLRASG